MFEQRCSHADERAILLKAAASVRCRLGLAARSITNEKQTSLVDTCHALSQQSHSLPFFQKNVGRAINRILQPILASPRSTPLRLAPSTHSSWPPARVLARAGDPASTPCVGMWPRPLDPAGMAPPCQFLGQCVSRRVVSCSARHVAWAAFRRWTASYWPHHRRSTLAPWSDRWC